MPIPMPFPNHSGEPGVRCPIFSQSGYGGPIQKKGTEDCQEEACASHALEFSQEMRRNMLEKCLSYDTIQHSSTPSAIQARSFPHQFKLAFLSLPRTQVSEE